MNYFARKQPPLGRKFRQETGLLAELVAARKVDFWDGRCVAPFRADGGISPPIRYVYPSRQLSPAVEDASDAGSIAIDDRRRVQPLSYSRVVGSAVCVGLPPGHEGFEPWNSIVISFS